MERLEAYIWDLDGTLIDSYGSIVASLAEVAKECGAADSDEKILKTVKQGSVSEYLRDLSAASGKHTETLYRLYRTVSHARSEEKRCGRCGNRAQGTLCIPTGARPPVRCWTGWD